MSTNRRVTLQEVADHAGVSRMAVSYALRDRGSIGDKTRRRIKAAAAELGYMPNAAARAMHSQHTGVVGILVENVVKQRQVFHPSLYEAVCGINVTLDEKDLISALIPLSDLERADRDLPRVFREHMLDAMIVLGVMPDWVEKKVASVARNVLWADTTVWRPRGCVRRDEAAAAGACVEHASAAGYDELLILSPPEDTRKASAHFSRQDRIDGARDAGNRCGLTVHETVVSVHEHVPREWKALRKRLHPGMAVVATSAYAAATVISQLGLPGVTGPDYGLASCDTYEMMMRTCPQLSCSVFDRFGLGIEVARRAILTLDEGVLPKSVSLASDWREGSTLRGPSS